MAWCSTRERGLSDKPPQLHLTGRYLTSSSPAWQRAYSGLSRYAGRDGRSAKFPKNFGV